MVRITIDVDTDNIIGVKETIAMDLEKYGDVKVMDISRREYKGRKPDTIGDRIRKARMGACLTQRDLAEAIFVSESLVCRWESNQRLPSVDDLEKIAEVTDVNEGWLMLMKGVTRQ